MQDDDDLSEAPEEVLDLVASVERQGWTLQVRHPRRGRRYWCSCKREHNIWIPTKVKSAETLDNLMNHMKRTTCWEEGS